MAGIADVASHSPRLVLGVFLAVLIGAPLTAFLTQEPRSIPTFKAGETAAMRLDGGRAMIISSVCHSTCEYWVRVANPTGYQSFWAAEYELTR